MPGQVLRGCSTCGAPFEPRHARHRHCPIHEPIGNAHRSPSTRTRPSSSTERARILTAVLERDPLCTLNLPGCTGASEAADHIVPAADGGRYELDNLRGACTHCNSVLGGRQAARLQHGEADGAGAADDRGSRAQPVPTGPRLR